MQMHKEDKRIDSEWLLIAYHMLSDEDREIIDDLILAMTENPKEKVN